MQRSDDPRNIFYNQRQSYTGEDAKQEADKTQPKQEQPRAKGAGGMGTSKNAGSSYDERLAEMKKLAAKYEREGEGQLVKDIVNSVIEQKAAGKLTNEQLLAFAKRISPLLNAEQRSRLNSLVEQLLKL